MLAEIGAAGVPELLAFNKADIAPAEAKRLSARHPESVVLSASTGEGIDELLRTIGGRLRSVTKVVELVVPYERGDVLAAVHREGEVLSETAEDDGMRLRARLDDPAMARFRDYVAS